MSPQVLQKNMKSHPQKNGFDYIPNLNVKKLVYNPEERPKRIKHRLKVANTTPFRKKKFFLKRMRIAKEKITGERTLEIIQFCLRWIPSSINFGIFFKRNYLSKSNLQIFQQLDLIHGYYDSYIILSMRNNDLEYFGAIIDSFNFFKSIKTEKKHSKLIFFRQGRPESANALSFLFTSPQGHGLIVKAIEDQRIGGNPNLELEIIRIGKIIGVNIPTNAMVIHNTGTKIFKPFSKRSNLFVETLTPSSIDLWAAEASDIEAIIEHDAVNLGKMLVFDTVCGSWDRHNGNYLVATIWNRKSLQEIDFGHFQPGFYKSKEFIPDSELQDNPQKHPSLPGWAIIRNLRVEKMIKRTNKQLLMKGIKDAILQLHHSISHEAFSSGVSKKLYHRVQGLFDPKHATYRLFFQELNELAIPSKKFEGLILQLSR